MPPQRSKQAAAALSALAALGFVALLAAEEGKQRPSRGLAFEIEHALKR
jgi:hypothetical protein